VLQVTINQGGKVAGVAGLAREDLDLAVAVALTASGGSTYSWALLDAPPNDTMTAASASHLSAITGSSVNITPDNSGTYYGTVTSGDETIEWSFYAGPALNADPTLLPRRIPAWNEGLAHNAADAIEPAGNTKGWKREWDRWFRTMKRAIQQAAAPFWASTTGSVQPAGITGSGLVALTYNGGTKVLDIGVGHHAATHQTGGADAIPVVTETVDGLMSHVDKSNLDGLRPTRFKTTSTALMQAITNAEVGDDCRVADSTSDLDWYAVAQGKYAHGLNCLAGIGVDWLFPIDRVAGTAGLVGGHAFVSLPGIDPLSVPQAWYISIIGDPGTPTAQMAANGININTGSPTDGSIVGFEVRVPL
jgi:hypothetical protein